MKKLMHLFLFCLIASCSWTTADAQSHCTNLGFELGDLTNWTLETRRYYIIPPSTHPQWEQVEIPAVFDRHIVFGNYGELPARFKNLSRLGFCGSLNYREPDPYRNGFQVYNWILGLHWAYVQKLRYSMTIDSTNALLIAKFQYSLIYRSDCGYNQGRFSFTLFDQKGDTIHDCANYSVDAANTTLAIVEPHRPPKWKVYKDWTTVGANLIKYWGQTVTIEFFSADDNAENGGITTYYYTLDDPEHGLVMLTAECQPLTKTVSFCMGDSVAALIAPEDFKTYKWTDSAGNVAGNHQILNVADPPDGALYSCSMTSETGCTITQQFKILRGLFTVDFSSSIPDCKSNKVLMDNLCTSKGGGLVYNWDFGDGTISSVFKPTHTFATSGLHTVSLTVTKLPTSCVTTLTKPIESFSPLLVGITASPFCHGMATTLKGYGAWNYTWGDHSTADSLVVKPPGGTYKLVGRSTTGCASDTIYMTVTEDPDWQLTDRSDTIICEGEFETKLAVSGAEKYLWNTWEQTSSIIVNMPGPYSVTGTNSKGCKKTLYFNVGKYPTPNAEFITSPALLYPEHNSLTCSITPQSDVFYTWDMGDGLTETGSTVEHPYNIGRKEQSYLISLTASNIYGCTRSASKNVYASPIASKVYPPNAFSPNATNEVDRQFCVTTDGVKRQGYHFVVISRWNDIVFETRNEIKGWDGRMNNGEYAQAGSYVWMLEYTDALNKQHRQTGSVELVY